MQYGLTFFKTALQTIQNEKIEHMKNIALSVRIAKFADEKDFKDFIEVKEEIKVKEDELLCL